MSTATPPVSSSALPEGLEPLQLSGSDAAANQEAMAAAQAEAKRHAADNKALAAYSRVHGMTIPEKFNGDYVAWFKSLSHADKAVTQATQKAAALEKQVEELKKVTVKPEPVSEVDTLMIPPKPKTPEAPTPIAPAPPKITEKEMQRFSSEVQRTGTLSAESRKLLEEAGHAPAVIDQMVGGIKAVQRVNLQTAQTVVGGAENLKTLLTWAQQELPESRVQELNAGLGSPLMETVLRGMITEYNQWADEMNAKAAAEEKAKQSASRPAQAQSRTPKSEESSAPKDESKTPFKTRTEIRMAKNDPRYTRDAAYRALVDQRILNGPPVASLPR